ncbi:MAG: C25 family cysteine peptidase, partial [candidate division Zixibacteria bacterium]|nr:C25 family cysteine peptidase [candidate division Zixibacteria bacterium]
GFENLARNNKTGFYYSVACDQAAYDLETLYGMTVPSVTEELLNLDSAGAIGVIAFTRWGWVSSSHKLMSSFYQHLFSDADGYPVQAMAGSWQDYPYYRDQIYGQNYFGDPSLRLYTGVPQQVALSAAETYDPHHPLECTVTLNGSPLAGQTVVADADGTTYWTAVTGDNGVAVFALPEGNTDNIRMTVFIPGVVAAATEAVPSIIADADDDDNPLPTKFDLQQNFPNPFNPATTIRFSLARMGEVSLEIYNILGQLVATPVEENLPAGQHDVVWDGQDRNGEPVSSGMYIYCLRSDEGVMTKTMALVK